VKMDKLQVSATKLAEVAALASTIDPKRLEEATMRLQNELEEKMKNMTPQERMQMFTAQQVLTSKAVEAIAESNLDMIKIRRNAADPQTQLDDILLSALRSKNLELFQQVMRDQRRLPTASARFVTDDEGHPLMHWAALDNNVLAIRFLFSLAQGDAKKLADQRNIRGETALSWACMKGHTKAIHELIRAGADIHAACSKGYSSMHVAAQNGHVFTMAQLARKGLQVDVRDNNGRTPLHWAAYKGFEGSTRWLLAHGADPGAQDWEKCMPIHWASLRAHASIVQVLAEHGASGPFLNVKDKTGGTPLSLAMDKVSKIARELAENPENEKVPGKNEFTKAQFERVVAYCKRRMAIEHMIEKNGGKPTLLMKISHRMPHWSYFLWPVFAPLGWWQYQTVVFPVTSHHLMLHLVFVVTFWAKWVFWVRLQVRDPGEYVVPYGPAGTTLGVGSEQGSSWGWRRNGFPDFTLRAKPVNAGSTSALADSNNINDEKEGGEVDNLIPSSDVRATKVNPNPAINAFAAKHRALYDRVLDEGLAVPVCVTCEIVKPVRGKHDKVTNVCVAKFDHFCPWMNSCVGELNYSDFFFTAVCATTCMWLFLILIVLYTWEIDTSKGWFENFASIWKWEALMAFYILPAVYGTTMTIQHIMLTAKNLSTNEMMSGYRYRYLVEDGTRGNPFNRGIVMNFAEMIGVVAPHQMDPEQYYVAELAGEDLRPVPVPVRGSPWHSVMRAHGVLGGEPVEDDHGHSHAGGDNHGHDHHGHSH